MSLRVRPILTLRHIAALKASITEHRTAFEEVVAIGDARAETFAKIVGLVDECRALKLPASATPEPMEVDKEPEAPRLSATSLPFQPGPPAQGQQQRPSSSVPNSRASTPAPFPLPSRPTRSTSATAPAGRYARGHGAAGLPPRPSNMRNMRVGGLEDGEVGEEDGEVKEGGKRRAEESATAPSGRARRK